MKNDYYIECEVNYNDECEIEDNEYYRYILSAKTENEVREIAKIRARSDFLEEYGDIDIYVKTVDIIECYLTSDDARVE